MSEAEAKILGLVGPDGAPGQTPGGPSGKPEAVPSDTGEASGDPVADDVAAHATELNAIGSTLDAAGIDAEDGLARSVEEVGLTGELPEDISEALIERFGMDDAQILIDNAQNYVATVAENAMAAAGLDSRDRSVVAGLDAALADQPRIFIDAVRGQSAKLNSAIFAYAASLKRSR
jgi:hypothetical protein